MATFCMREKECIPISKEAVESCKVLGERRDGKVLIASRDHKVHVVKLSEDIVNSNSRIIKSYSGHTKAVRDVEYSAEGDKIISVSNDNRIIIRDRCGTDILEMKDHNRNITSVALNANSTKIVTASEDCSFIVWNVVGTKMSVFGKGIENGHRGWINASGFIPNSPDLYVTGSEDGTVKIWDLENNCLLKTIFEGAQVDYDKARETRETVRDYDFDNAVKTIAFSKEGSLLAYGGRNSKAYIMNLNKNELLQVIEMPDKITALAFGENQPLLAIAIPGKIILWHIIESKIVSQLEFATGEAYCTSLVFVGDELVAGLFKGDILRIELSNN